ncbi:MAG: PhzF family phenazine biosynthesis protein [Bacteroidetes bacterium]|nr:PhzF family phenazine biosynthesis protein [Bacteroidota bacterium]MCL5737759.1 PhzF family phenazine biosynthesis protein [Bacteroidota bacterium]
MKIPIYQIDAFTEERFHGNPAAVCILENWLPDELMQHIAAENNLAETAFVVPKGDAFELRWFTPKIEIDLCGHATLATAYAYKEHLNYQSDEITFKTKSGILKVIYGGDFMSMIFPRRPGEPCSVPDNLINGINAKPAEVLKSRDYLVILNNEDEIRNLKPDFEKLKTLDCLGVIVTAKGWDVDFVSRFFAPNAGVPEDPVTGSSHSTLIPYWSKKLGKNKLTALQLSERGGKLFCEDLGDKVKIAGKAVTYLVGEISV